jgi:gliding motility-associated-like protein
VDAGPDRGTCNDDTLHLEAPSGFLSYEWSNNYKLSSTISQHVVANPLIDTSYYLKAEKLPGCYAFDTVKVIVNSSLPLYLGNDRTLCDGDSVLLDPGPGFVKYLWSTNASSQQLIAKKSAIYSIAATSNDGCKSYDTLKVLVFNNPKVQLDHTNSLCAGTSRVLDAGNFASYLWNDGSTLRTLNINATGMYNVDVTDAYGCTGKDTATISALLPLPANFLPSDTALCSYSTLALKPLQNFKSYTWSTNQLTASVTISKPGLYWLQVVDISSCIGKDSIVINPKECMFGFYIPTAFTPNRDGKNDLFHPFIFGNLKQYEFIIYNRWGQVIFQTKEFAKAWDGTFSGYMLESNIYVWTCTFQLEGEEIKQEKGTVMLTR